ncbi:VOC family protein [Vibrio hepatarius]|uniref:VOC family protein n=1 Tax=Vibrio hepatarius TaxID=171383 RepID=UPI001C08D415|nr:VOC family protein [Vibrio hepatarius]MBU2896674.1 glyoxalase [Vibrio hepatarius]
MLTIDSVVLYVKDIEVSQRFYTQVLGCESTILSPTFVAINFANNITVTLKQNTDLTPVSSITGGGSELSVVVSDSIKLQQLYQSWKGQLVEFAQHPIQLSFGVNFVAIDPDGHRIRVFSPKVAEL